MPSTARLMLEVGEKGTAATQGKLTGLSAQVNAAAKSFKTQLGMISLVAAGAAVIGLGIATTKMAGDFQAGMTTLVTGAGEAEGNLKRVSDGILGLSVDTGTSTKQMTDGMFLIESAGFHGAVGLDVLKNAAEGAKVGSSDLASVANGVTTEMVDFAGSNLSAAQATNILIATVADGKTHMADLANSMAAILPTASAMKIKLIDVQGAMATMTGEGVPAADAATFLRQTLMALETPGSQAVQTLKSIGLSSKDVSDEMKKSLPDALQLITDHLAKKFPPGSAAYVNALKDIAGGSKQMQGILDLTGDHLGTFKGNVANITDAVKKGGNSITGWGKVQQDFNLKLDRAKEVIETTGIKIGSVLLPVAGKLADVLVNNIVPGIANVVKTGANIIAFFQGTSVAATLAKGALFILTGALLGMAASAIPAAVTGLIASVTAFWAQAAAATAAAIATMAALLPFILIGAAIGAVVFGIIMLVSHWKQVSAFLEGAWKATVNGVMAGLHALGAFFGAVFSAIGTAVHQQITNIQTAISTGFNFIKTIVMGAIHFVVDLFKWLFDHNYYFHNLVVNIQKEFKLAQQIVTTIWNAIMGFIVGVWNGIKDAALAVWTWITSYIHQQIDRVRLVIAVAMGIILGVWNTVWGKVSAFVGQIWANITGKVNDGINQAKAPITDLATWLGTFFANLATTALDWGKNLIGGFISGMEQMAGKVKDTAGNIAGGIAKFLGFHSPSEEGPGRTAHLWSPNLMKMFIDGILSSIPNVQQATGAVMAHVAAGLAGGAPRLGLGVSGLGSHAIPFASGIPAHASGSVSNSYGGDTYVIHAHGPDPAATARQVMREIQWERVKHGQ